MRGRPLRFRGGPGIAALGLGAALAWLLWFPTGDGRPPVGTTGRPAVEEPASMLRADELPAAASLDAGSPVHSVRREAMDPGPAPIIDPSTEREFYEAFKVQGAASLERSARERLEESGPDSGRVALLRALYDLRSPAAADLFTWAIRNLPSEATGVGESVPSFAVRFLGDHARRDPQARSALENVAFASQPPVALGLRRRAAASLAATASETELLRLSRWLARESDHLVVEGALAALEHNPNVAAATAMLTEFGRLSRIESQPGGHDPKTRKERLP